MYSGGKKPMLLASFQYLNESEFDNSVSEDFDAIRAIALCLV
jgi:hypothetical protein